MDSILYSHVWFWGRLLILWSRAPKPCSNLQLCIDCMGFPSVISYQLTATNVRFILDMVENVSALYASSASRKLAVLISACSRFLSQPAGTAWRIGNHMGLGNLPPGKPTQQRNAPCVDDRKTVFPSNCICGFVLFCNIFRPAIWWAWKMGRLARVRWS